MTIAKELLAVRAEVVVYDPIVRVVLSNGPARASVADSPLEAARGADAVVVVATEWAELASVDLMELRREMRGNVLVDGRGIVPPAAARDAGFDYFGFGRGPALDLNSEEAPGDGQVSAKAS
ncbi:hypothetical protein BH18CHL2_BH18CHL2_10900 [soil metagenome]